MTFVIYGRHIVATALLAALLLTFAPMLTQAAELEAIAEEAKTADYQSLKSIVSYLTAYRDALEAGEPVATTFVTALSGNVVRVDGTIVRAQNRNMMEICGPMVKGEIAWGDGVKESLHGLGCSGDVYRFVAYHAYDEKGSRTITVSGGAGRDERRVVAAGTAGSDVSKLLETSFDGELLEVTGTVMLDDALPRTCPETQIATVFWGDGNSEAITTDCASMSYDLTYEYPRPGTYKVLVIDTDGDAVQELVMVAE
jgi:hypothetical protein